MPICDHLSVHNEESIITTSPTPIQRVAAMNVAFNNPKGDYHNMDATAISRLRKQCLNIFDEYCELLTALGFDQVFLESLKGSHRKRVERAGAWYPVVNAIQVRDALCDIQVFAAGAQHMMGVDGDADMHAVIDGVMTRFVKDRDDLKATMEMHRAKGVCDVYVQGAYPTVVLKSASDQPDAPTGKFLKSASYKETVFPDVAD